MRLKALVKLFVPPIFIKILRLFNRKIDFAGSRNYSEKEIAYNYFVDVMQRKKLNFADIKKLSNDYTFEQLNSITIEKDEVNYYGDFSVLNQYCDSIFPNLSPVKFTIQHGIIFFLDKWEYSNNRITNLVWSEKIASLYRNELSNMNAYAIGSPFFYAKSLLSQEKILEEKKRLGRNLLAFPMHSTHWVLSVYDPKRFIEVLKDQQKKFDTVRVCVYWKDIQEGFAEPYLKAGFECVTCGHIFDQYFLQRQKSLFEIADATISNRIGSQAGYSIFMNKPHWIIPDNFEKKENGNIELYNDYVKSGIKEKEYDFITEAFMNNQNYQITETQKKIVDEYWGISSMKTKEELSELISKCYVRKE